METKYTKLTELVGSTFTVEKVWGYKFKKWDNEQRKMLVSDRWQEGYRKVYEVDTDKGKLDLSSSQMGQVLEAHVKNGQVDLNGKTTQVKSNGKTGMEIRYYFNPVVEDTERRGTTEPQRDEPPKPDEPKISLEDIPF